MTIVSIHDIHQNMVKVGRVACHKAHEVCHAAYLALVFKEAHGYYGYAAGALLLVIVLGWIVGEEKEGHHDAVHHEVSY